MITRKQLELFNYIHREVTNSGVAPSFDEMKAALNLKYLTEEIKERFRERLMKLGDFDSL